MNGRVAVALVAGAIAIAAIAYGVGVRYGGPSDTAVVEGPISTPIPATPGEPMDLAQLSDDQRAAVEDVIQDYLMTNPEIIRDAINELQRREDEAAQLAQTQAIDENSDAIFASNRQVVLGNPDGDVTLVEFFDYNCAYCRRAHADMQQLLTDDPNLRIVLKEFPVLGPGSVEAAQISAAVMLTAPDSAGAFHDALLTSPGQVDGKRALAVAEDLGLDPDALSAAADGDEVKAVISESYGLAGKLNLTGTPSYVTKREVVVGAVGYDALREKIEEARNCTTVTC